MDKTKHEIRMQVPAAQACLVVQTCQAAFPHGMHTKKDAATQRCKICRNAIQKMRVDHWPAVQAYRNRKHQEKMFEIKAQSYVMTRRMSAVKNGSVQLHGFRKGQKKLGMSSNT